MGQVLIGVIIGALLGGGLGALIAVSGKGEGFIASDKPVTEDQVRAKLEAQGWTDVKTSRDERYIEAIASKNGGVGQITVDSLTGQLIVDNRNEG